MKTFKSFLISRSRWLSLLALVLAMPVMWPASQAATQNYATGVETEIISLHISGQYTATTDPVAKFAMPYRCRVVGISATARASGGTTPTLTVDVEDDTVSVLSSAISITAGTVAEGTIANPAVADESVMEVILTIGGTTPTWNDITVLITVVRT